jgi:FolB domain-containing protein
MIIKINNIILSGVHGLTEKEKNKPQKFKIDVEVVTWKNKNIEDDIEATFDYRKIKKVITETIEGKQCLLLETLAENIADKVVKNKNVSEVKVEVSKVDIWDNGFPSVVVSRQNTSFSGLLDFDMESVVQALLFEGAVSVPLIPEAKRLMLQAEAEMYEYEKQPEIVGPANVREQLSSFYNFPKESLFVSLKDDFTELVNYKLSQMIKNPFKDRINFNELSLQKYEKGSIGITPHKDNFSSVDFIAVFLIKGKGNFALCDDRAGTNPRFLDTTVGNVIFMRAPNFFGSTKRPFHFVSDITEERISFGLRRNTT